MNEVLMRDDGRVRGARRRRWAVRATALLLATALFLTGIWVDPVVPAAGDPPHPAIAVWLSTPGGHWLEPRPDLVRTATAFAAVPTLTIDPAQRFQRIAGFGGAFNERGWQALLALAPARRQGVLRALFDPLAGAGYSLARAPIGASDYALDAYSLDDVPGDLALRRFGIARDERYLLPYIRAALAIAPDLSVWASPWSAPAWMKTNGSMVHGGSLRAADEPVYARYLADYLLAYRAAGVPISALSIQNEPSQSTPYPSMVMPAAQMARLVGDLGPLLARLGLRTTIRVNEEPSRDRWRYTLDVIADPLARPYITGSDIHGYHGAATDLAQLHAALPGLDIWQSEDTNLDHPHLDYGDGLRWAGEIAGDLNQWAAGWDFWNMVTDATAMSSWGWRQDAVVLVNMRHQTVTYTPKYYAMAHFSRFIRPGAVRLGLHGVPAGLAATAALDPDGRTVLVVVNPHTATTRFAIALGGRQAMVMVPGQGIATFVWSTKY